MKWRTKTLFAIVSLLCAMTVAAGCGSVPEPIITVKKTPAPPFFTPEPTQTPTPSKAPTPTIIFTSPSWDTPPPSPDETTPTPTPAPAKTLSGIAIGDTAASVDTLLGPRYRTLDDSGGTYAIYYSADGFKLVKFAKGVVAYVYSYAYKNENVDKTYTDPYGTGKIYAAAIGSIGTASQHVNEQILFELTNAYRLYSGKSMLAWNEKLAAVARLHSEDMANNDFADHTSSDGRSYGTRLSEIGYSATMSGENLAVSSNNAVAALDSWIRSEATRANLLSDYSDVGIGFAYKSGSSYNGYRWTQAFGR